MPRLRVATLNTWKNEGRLEERIPRMAAALEALAADVVLLQECFRVVGGGVDTARDLSSGPGLELAFAPARRCPRRWEGRSVASDSGHAIVVRGVVEGLERLVLPTTPAGGERIALLVRALLPGCGSVVAGCLHLSHLRGDDAGRREQLETILAHRWWVGPAAARVLGGDANAEATGAALAWLADPPGLTVERLVVGDASRRPTHPVPLVPGRAGRVIDHLWAVGPRGERLPAAIACGVACDGAEGGPAVSDHALVWADIDTGGGA